MSNVGVTIVRNRWKHFETVLLLFKVSIFAELLQRTNKSLLSIIMSKFVNRGDYPRLSNVSARLRQLLVSRRKGRFNGNHFKVVFKVTIFAYIKV